MRGLLPWHASEDMNETVTDGILKVAGGTFLTMLAMILILSVYVWVADRWERVMNFRKARHLQLEIDGLEQRLMSRDMEIMGLRRQLATLQPRLDKEDEFDDV